jgi:DNA-binding transcriptional MocR family regulator
MNAVMHPTIALLQSSSLTTVVQQEIERAILVGEYAPGSKLIEATLAEKLGVSRGPVREAFRMLEEAGLVRNEKNRGVFVRDIPIDEAWRSSTCAPRWTSWSAASWPRTSRPAAQGGRGLVDADGKSRQGR